MAVGYTQCFSTSSPPPPPQFIQAFWCIKHSLLIQRPVARHEDKRECCMGWDEGVDCNEFIR